MLVVVEWWLNWRSSRLNHTTLQTAPIFLCIQFTGVWYIVLLRKWAQLSAPILNQLLTLSSSFLRHINCEICQNTENRRSDDGGVCKVSSIQFIHTLSFFFSHLVLLSKLQPSMNENSRFHEKWMSFSRLCCWLFSWYGVSCFILSFCFCSLQ